MTLDVRELNIGDPAAPIVNIETTYMGEINLVGISGIVSDKQTTFTRSDSSPGYSYNVFFNPAVVSTSGTNVSNLWLTENDLGLVSGDTNPVDPAVLAGKMSTGEMNVNQALSVMNQAKTKVLPNSPFYDLLNKYSTILESMQTSMLTNSNDSGINVTNAQSATEYGLTSLIMQELSENIVNMDYVYSQQLAEIQQQTTILNREFEQSFHDQNADEIEYQKFLQQANSAATAAQQQTGIAEFVQQLDNTQLTQKAKDLLYQWGVDLNTIYKKITGS